MEEFLRLCFEKKKDEALEVWTTKVRPPTHTLGSADYTPVYDQRWWLWCTTFQEQTKGVEALERLLLSATLKYPVQQTFLGNAATQIRALPVRRRVGFPPTLGPGWMASSPSLLVNPLDPEGFLVCVRHVNYRFLPDNTYPLVPEYEATTKDPYKGKVRTRYHVHVVNQALEIQTSVELKDNTSILRWPSPVLDLEDLRLVALPSGKLVGLAASRELIPSTLPQVALVSVSLEKKEMTQGTRLFPHIPEASAECQKNWMPFWNARAKELQAFYVLGPEAVVLRLDPVSGVSRVAASWPTRLAPHSVRGGAPPVPWNDGFLSVVHTSLQPPGVRRKYFHRFVRHTSDYRPVAVSSLWNFSGSDLDAEFVLGCVRASPTSLYLGYGQNDNACWVAEVEDATVEGLVWISL